MKNNWKLIAIVVVATSALIFAYRAEASKVKFFEKSNFASPRALYLNNCARCHGADGKGDTELGRSNDAPDISGGFARQMGDGKLRRVILNGDGSMPGFGKTLTKSQITKIIRYIKGL